MGMYTVQLIPVDAGFNDLYLILFPAFLGRSIDENGSGEFLDIYLRGQENVNPASSLTFELLMYLLYLIHIFRLVSSHSTH